MTVGSERTAIMKTAEFDDARLTAEVRRAMSGRPSLV